jgi:hypothetical protein
VGPFKGTPLCVWYTGDMVPLRKVDDELISLTRPAEQSRGRWSVDRWFASKNVVDLFRYRPAEELKRMARLWTEHARQGKRWPP